MAWFTTNPDEALIIDGENEVTFAPLKKVPRG